MGKNYNYDYCRTGETMEIVVRDGSMKKIEQFKANINDKKECRRILSYIEHKYDLLKPEISTERSVNNRDNDNWLEQ